MKRNNKTLAKIKRGFTLVELVIVIAVIAILAAVLIPTFITVIDSANNSADVQLVANMNAVLATDFDADSTATAENLRKLMKDNGIDNFETKKSDNVILYDKSAKKFVLMSDFEKKVKAASLSAAGKTGAAKNLAAKPLAEEGGLTLDENAYSPEEIFDGYIITSTGGNDFVEGLYNLHNLSQGNEFWTSADVKNVQKLFNGMSGEAKTALMKIVNSSYYIAADGQIVNFWVDTTLGVRKWYSNSEDTQNDKDNQPVKTRVVFNEGLKDFSLKNLIDVIGDQSILVVIPQTVEQIIDIPENQDLGIMLLGNTSIITDEQKAPLSKLGVEIAQTSLSEVREELVKSGPVIAKSEFYFGEEDNFDQGKYNDLQVALDDAGISSKYSGLARSVIITLKNYTINQNITVPKGVTLEIPFCDQNSSSDFLDNDTLSDLSKNCRQYSDGTKNYYCGEGAGYPTAAVGGMDIFTPSKTIAPENKKQYEVTIAQDVTVTVNGTIRVGGVIGYTEGSASSLSTADSYQGHTSGNYGQITNNGTIAVEGGKLDVWGFVKGEGSVVADNGTVCEPFVVTDFMGGTNTVNFYYKSQYTPFREYGVVNIQCPMTINYGANLMAHCNLFAIIYNRTDAYLITSNPTAEAVIKLKEGASATTTYDPSKSVEEGIGKVSLKVMGQAETGVLSLEITFGQMNVATVSTDTVLFPMPYNFDLTIEGHFTVKNQYTILPGASVTVNGTLEVASGAKLYVLDWMPSNVEIVGAQYPDAAMLKNEGYNSYGELKVNGTMIVDEGGHAGGLISSEKQGAKLEVKAGAQVADKDIRIGGVASDATNNVNIYTDLALRLVSAEGAITSAVAGKTYTMGEVKTAQRTFSDIKTLVKVDSANEDTIEIKYYKDEWAAISGAMAGGTGGESAYFNKQDTTAPQDAAIISGGWTTT